MKADDAEPWQRDASCRQSDDPDIWFPETRGRSAAMLRAKEICRSCPVSTECLEAGLSLAADGIWGGLSEYQRRPLLRAYRSSVTA